MRALQSTVHAKGLITSTTIYLLVNTSKVTEMVLVRLTFSRSLQYLNLKTVRTTESPLFNFKI